MGPLHQQTSIFLSPATSDAVQVCEADRSWLKNESMSVQTCAATEVASSTQDLLMLITASGISANFVFSCSWLHSSVKTSEANWRKSILTVQTYADLYSYWRHLKFTRFADIEWVPEFIASQHQLASLANLGFADAHEMGLNLLPTLWPNQFPDPVPKQDFSVEVRGSGGVKTH